MRKFKIIKHQGFTVMEIIISLAILTTMLVSFLFFFSQNFKTGRHLKTKVQIELMWQSIANILRNKDNCIRTFGLPATLNEAIAGEIELTQLSNMFGESLVKPPQKFLKLGFTLEKLLVSDLANASVFLSSNKHIAVINFTAVFSLKGSNNQNLTIKRTKKIDLIIDDISGKAIDCFDKNAKIHKTSSELSCKDLGGEVDSSKRYCKNLNIRGNSYFEKLKLNLDLCLSGKCHANWPSLHIVESSCTPDRTGKCTITCPQDTVLAYGGHNYQYLASQKRSLFFVKDKNLNSFTCKSEMVGCTKKINGNSCKAKCHAYCAGLK